MARLFSKRKKHYPTDFRYDLPDDVRSRIIVVFKDYCNEANGGFDELLVEVGNVLIKEYGFLSKSAYAAARRSDHPVIEHFFVCNDEQAIDFIEVCFQQHVYNGGQSGVDEINEIFRDCGIGYELTPFIEHQVEKETYLFGKKRLGTVIEYEYPKVIQRNDQIMHESVIEPTLELLSDSRFRVANSEIIQAHSALRSGEFEDAITLSCSAFESFLKTILDIKGWSYDPYRDTCAKLVSICRDKNLIPPFYCSAFETVGTIRNKLGDAHGRGPQITHQAKQEHAEHLIQMTSAHMLFIAKTAAL